MKITIHQPEHWPYEGFFQKVEASDFLVILDNCKFKKNNFQNRNRFKPSNGKEEWVTVPVEKAATSKRVKDVKVSGDPNWRRKVISKLKHHTNVDFTDVYQSESLLEINMTTILLGMALIGLQRPFEFASTIVPKGKGSAYLAAIVRELGATGYISGPSGHGYLDKSHFKGIDLEFFSPKVDHHYSVLQRLVDAEQPPLDPQTSPVSTAGLH